MPSIGTLKPRRTLCASHAGKRSGGETRLGNATAEEVNETGKQMVFVIKFMAISWLGYKLGIELWGVGKKIHTVQTVSPAVFTEPCVPVPLFPMSMVCRHILHCAGATAREGEAPSKP